MKLKSSAKIKRRYLLFSPASREEIEKIILDYLGILGWSKASPVFVKNKQNRVILSIARAEIDNVKAAFELSNSNIKIIKVSGTLKALLLQQ